MSSYVKTHNELLLKLHSLNSELTASKILNNTLQAKISELESQETLNFAKILDLQGNVNSLEDKVFSLKKKNLLLEQTVEKEQVLKLKKDEELEELTEKYLSINSTLNKYKSNKYISKMVEVEVLSEKLHERLSFIESKFIKEINNRQDYNERLKKYISEHSRCKNNLEDCSIAWRKSKFPHMVNCFQTQYQQNNDKIKKIFKVIYDIKKESKKLNLNRVTLNMLEEIAKIQILIESQYKTLNNLQEVSFQSDLDQERISFDELIRTAQQEIDVYVNLYKTNAGLTTRSNKSTSDCLHLNDLNQPNSSASTTKSEKCDDENIDVCDPDENALVIFNMTESETPASDQYKIKSFLINLGVVGVGQIFIERMGKKKGKKKVRPVKVIFRNEEVSTQALNKIKAGVPENLDTNIRAERYHRSNN